jgi:benzoyl-CoA-dihydrodiol lyase
VATSEPPDGAYQHWVVSIEAPVATLTLHGGGDRVDVELADALERLRFEHPEVGTVVLLSDRSGLHLETRLDGALGGPVRARGPESEAVVLPPLWPEEFDGGFAYPNVRVELNPGTGPATVTLVGPSSHECFAPEPGPRRLRSRWWPLAVCREFSDALLQLRRERPDGPGILVRTEGDPLAVASADVALSSGYEHDWFVREVVLAWRRVLRRLDAAAPEVIAVVEPGSCFVGTLLEVALAAGGVCMTDDAELFLTGMNFGPLHDASGRTRLESRFPDGADQITALSRRVGDPIDRAEAARLGLVADQPSGTSR